MTEPNIIKNNRFEILTQSGFQDFDAIQDNGEQETVIIETDSEIIEVSLGHKFIVDGQEIFACDLEIGDTLETIDGLQVIKYITQSYNRVYDFLETGDNTYYQDNILNSNCHFIGSSMTLLNQETLEKLTSTPELYIRDEKLKIYKEPEKGEKYIMTVDGQKDGTDYFTVQVFKITNFPFEQVQAQSLQVNYLLMPDFLLEWQESYNYQYIIIENNEGQGQSVQDVLYLEHEYENIHFDKKQNTKIRQNKEHPGFRTTRGNRPVILNTLKTFLEEEKLIIHDQDLIEEFHHFLLIKNKYQADDGYHDDMIMGQAFLFQPFIDMKNFDGFREVVQALYDKDSDSDFDFMDSIVFGSFDQEYVEDDLFNDFGGDLSYGNQYSYEESSEDEFDYDEFFGTNDNF